MFWTLFGMLCWLAATVVIATIATDQLKDCQEFFDFLVGSALMIIALASVSGWIIVFYDLIDWETA